jgi:hypothetical protein
MERVIQRSRGGGDSHKGRGVLVAPVKPGHDLNQPQSFQQAQIEQTKVRSRERR